jgi:crossover junction endodeoxyribonuclease RuvC
MPMPLAGSDVDFGFIADVLYNRYIETSPQVVCVAYVEKVGAMPKQGVTSMFNFGFVTGGVHGVLAAFAIPRYSVPPTEWKNVVLKGTTKDKDAAVEYCRMAWPETNLLATPRSKKPHSGMADALCIAKYAQLTHR